MVFHFYIIIDRFIRVVMLCESFDRFFLSLFITMYNKRIWLNILTESVRSNSSMGHQNWQPKGLSGYCGKFTW